MFWEYGRLFRGFDLLLTICSFADINMNIHCHRRAAFTTILGLITVALIILIGTKIGRKEAVNRMLKRELDYFVAVNSPLHSRCRKFRRKFPVVNKRDGDMDIAFTLVVHKDPLQIARLLRMIYRKNNYYCIHADLRSNQDFLGAPNHMAKRFGPNVLRWNGVMRVFYCHNWSAERKLFDDIPRGSTLSTWWDRIFLFAPISNWLQP